MFFRVECFNLILVRALLLSKLKFVGKMEDSANEALLNHLRNELRKENIKLWEEPYTALDGSRTDHMFTLAQSISVKLNLLETQVSYGLEHLRNHALEKQKQNLKYKIDKLATLRLKFSSKNICKKVSVVETKLDINGAELTNLIADKVNVSADLLKLVYSGKIINKELSLSDQGVQHNKTIMCLYFSPDSKQQAAQAEEEMQEVRKARRGAELLATSSSASVHQMDAQITDQNGRSINLPSEERVALMIALALHEKGRAVLKTEKYSFALLFLLEAENEFCQCRADILNQVDNFAVLHLDISWCYLRLENLDVLHDASKRLQICENCFKRSYGESLQRLRAIKGSAGHEIALFVRLYVLQGIVAYHEGKFTSARDLLSKAQFYADSVQVDGDKITEMVAVGFSVAEARLALRACEGNLIAATRHAFLKQEEKEKIRKEEKEKSRKRRLAQSLGKCENGDEINVDIFEQMVNDLGFDRTLAAESLKKCNNSLHDAVQLIHENPDSLKPKKFVVSEALIQQVIEAGFDPNSARAALHHFRGDVSLAVEHLLSNDGIVDEDWLEDARSSRSIEKLPEQLLPEDKEAVNMLSKVVNTDEDAYLDIELHDELEYVSTYLAKISSVVQ